MDMRIIHPAIRVADPEATIKFYDENLGLKLDARADLGEAELIFLKDENSGVELELFVEKGRDAAIKVDDGFHHLAFSTADIQATHKRMADAGLNPTDVTPVEVGGQVIATLFYITDPDGYTLEIVERGGRWA